MARFPHLRSESAFPDPGSVDVYKYDNQMDYGRFDGPQMRITLMSVPWDLGEAHVGQRTIEGVGNVVHFGSAEARDAYMDGLPEDEVFRFETKFRRFHSDDYVDVPVPVTSLSDYNYVEIFYHSEPGEGPDLKHTREPVERWYYFIRDFERKASNTTRCNIMIDTWQTFVYSIEIPYMFLERGHYPVAASDVDRYLADPLGNSEWLTGRDASFGELTRTGETGAVILNGGGMLAVVVTTGLPSADAWGTPETEGWKTPGASARFELGAPAPTAIAMDASDLQGFLEEVDSSAPQFKQTVQGVFFVSRDLVSLQPGFTFFGTTCHLMNAVQERFPIIELGRESFGYPARYADLAKLYTFPYAALDLYDEKGAAVRVHVEDTAGTIELTARLSYVWPWVNVDGRVLGVGSAERKTVSFYNSIAFDFTYGGRWHEILRTWDVPVYGAIQGGHDYNGFATHWSREQNAYAAQNRRANENAAAEADLDNAATNASTTVANAGLQTSANTAINNTSNSAATQDATYTNGLNQALQAWNSGFSRATQRLEAESEYQSAAVSSAAGVLGSMSSGAISGGTAGGAIGAAVGAVTGLVSGGISAANTMAQTAISTDLAATKVEASISNSQAQVDETNNNTNDRTSLQTSTNTSNKNSQNGVISGTAANSAAATNTTAARTYGVRNANADRDYDVSISANANQVREAGLKAPTIFGTPKSGETAASRPMAMFATVVTQSPGAIAQAGDMFLRYGYNVSRCIDFQTFNVMPKFSFWQCSDLWLKSSTVPDAYMDQIRMLLFGGVTVWRDPADIGHTSIYGNV